MKKIIIVMMIALLVFPCVSATLSFAYDKEIIQEDEKKLNNNQNEEPNTKSTQSPIEEEKKSDEEEKITDELDNKDDTDEAKEDENEVVTTDEITDVKKTYKTQAIEKNIKVEENKTNTEKNNNKVKANTKENNNEIKEKNSVENNKNTTKENKTMNINNDIQLLSTQGSKIEEGTYYIQTAVNSNIILNIESNSKKNNAKIQLSRRVGKPTVSQKFIIKSVGNGYYTIQNKRSGKVLDVDGAKKTNGTRVQQYTSNGTDAQKWLIKDAGNGYYYIISKCNGKYIDIPGGRASSGVNLQMYSGNKTNAQKFRFVKVEEVVAQKTKENGTYYIKSASNKNIAIEVKNSATTNGTNVQLGSHSNIVKNNQRFIITHKGNGYYEIKAAHSNKVLDVEGAGIVNGTNVQQYASNNTDAQRWIIKDNKDGTYSIISKANDLYLDVSCGSIKNGSNIQVYEGNGTKAQKFIIEKVEKVTSCKKVLTDGTYKITTAVSNKKVLDISGGNTGNGANLQIWDTDTVLQQRFKVTYNKEGYYEIKCVHSGKVLDVASGSTKNGANVQQYTSNGTNAQKWILQDAGNGYFYIMNKGSEKYLDISGASTKNGANIQIYEGNGTKAQKFKFTKASDLHGIDVSEFNGAINWENVKKSGIDFAIIRVGYRGYRTGAFAEDKYFKKNIAGAKKAGLKVGVYFFTQAVSEAEAREEATWTMNKIKEAGYENNIDFHIAIDTESSGGNPPGRADGLNVTKRTAICKAFCEKIKSKGYKPMIYASRDWFYNKLNMSQLNQYDIWLAHYTGSSSMRSDYKYHYEMWQYTSSGKITGVPGRVDMNILF